MSTQATATIRPENGISKTTQKSVEIEHVMRLHYLDSPVERATICILRELGISVEYDPDDSLGTNSFSDIKLEGLLKHEHTSTSVIHYEVAHGHVYLDIRDSGDSWIRAMLSKGVKMSLPPGLYRRFVFDSLRPVQVALRQSVTSSHANLTPRFSRNSDALEIVSYHKYRELICELCRQFYADGWVTGTGGSITIRYGNRLYMTPSGVQKERILPDELYCLDIDGNMISVPQQKPGGRTPKLSDCSPLFLHAYRLRNAGAVIHSHGMSCNLITALFDGQKEFRISHQEMIKGIAGYAYNDELVIPIIENTPRESQLADSLSEAIQNYPKAFAVLVRRHGIYVWGDSWEAAKRHSECLHYLFQCALEMHQLGFDFRLPPKGATENSENNLNSSRKKRLRLTEENENEKDSSLSETVSSPSFAEQHKYVLLDIEGTTTPITFVKDVLFPYARTHAETFLQETWDSSVTQADVEALRAQAEEDFKKNVGTPAIALSSASKDTIISSLVDYIAWNIKADRKITALKQIQGHIWDRGYRNGELKSLVYEDVPPFLARMEEKKIKVGIYSSGSREAQRSLFKYSDKGDLRGYLSCFFDTKVGGKREAASYQEILQSLGVDHGKQVLFVTDVIQEAEAAAQVGINVLLSVRPGNLLLPAKHPFKTIKSFAEL